MGHDLFRRSFRDDLAAMHARARADVDHMIRLEDRVLVMLHDEHRIAEVAQVLQRFEEARIVALMQPDGRLVEHVQHAGQPGADLRGEPDALAFAAGQRAGISAEREIVEADIVQEAQALADFLQDARGDLVLLGGELVRQLVEPRIRRADRQPRRLADMLAIDLHRQSLRLQPEARAFLAWRIGLIARQFLAHPLAFRLLPAPLDIGDDAFEGFPRRVSAHPVVIGERDGLAARAEQDHVLHLLRQLAPRRLHRDVEVVRDGFQRLRVIGRGVAGARPGHDRALAQAQRLVGHDKRRLEFQLGAEAIAFRAGAERVVERE